MSVVDTTVKIAISQFEAEIEGKKSDLILFYAGLAIFWAQCVEKTLENMLIVKELSEKSTLTNRLVEETFDKIENSKSTMGKLTFEVKKAFAINDKHTNQLKNVLERRNYFAHKFFKVNSFKPYTEKGQKAMILECARFIDDCKKIDFELTNYSRAYYLKTGLTEEVIKKTFIKFRQEEYDKAKNNVS